MGSNTEIPLLLGHQKLFRILEAPIIFSSTLGNNKEEDFPCLVSNCNLVGPENDKKKNSSSNSKHFYI